MNRKQLIKFVNNDILPQINKSYTWKDMFVSGNELIKLVIEFRNNQIKAGEAKANDILTAKVIDGYLYINETPIKRIAPKDPRPAWSEAAYYYEGKILARQEAAYIE